MPSQTCSGLTINISITAGLNCKSLFKGRIHEEVREQLERIRTQAALPALPRSIKAERGSHKTKTEFRHEKGLQRHNLLAEMKEKGCSQKCFYL